MKTNLENSISLNCTHYCNDRLKPKTPETECIITEPHPQSYDQRVDNSNTT